MNREVKFFVKIKKKIWAWSVRGGGAGSGWEGQGGCE